MIRKKSNFKIPKFFKVLFKLVLKIAYYKIVLKFSLLLAEVGQLCFAKAGKPLSKSKAHSAERSSTA